VKYFIYRASVSVSNDGCGRRFDLHERRRRQLGDVRRVTASSDHLHVQSFAAETERQQRHRRHLANTIEAPASTVADAFSKQLRQFSFATGSLVYI